MAPSAGSIVLDARSLRRAVVDFDASDLSAAQAADAVAELAAAEKAAAAAKARAAVRAAELGAHRTKGFADAADWLARESGTSRRAAKAALEVAGALDECPRVRRALVNGRLSIDQAHEIVRTEQAVPGSEAELVDLAARVGLGLLREKARGIRARAEDPDERHRRQHRERSFRHWINGAGNVAFAGQVPPEIGTPIMHRIDAETDRVRRDAKRRAADNGDEVEAWDAQAADALVNMLTGQATAKPGRTDMVIVCDVNAYRRGHTHPGEACHIIGAGPIPVDLARRLTDDAFLKAVLHDGTAIHTVAHFGRHIPAHLRTALELGAPPHFEGVTCDDEGCERRHHLQWDHVDPVANHGPASYENLKARCCPHHDEKTRRDRAAGLLDGRPRPTGHRPEEDADAGGAHTDRGPP